METRLLDCPAANITQESAERESANIFVDNTNSGICDPFLFGFARIGCGTSGAAGMYQEAPQSPTQHIIVCDDTVAKPCCLDALHKTASVLYSCSPQHHTLCALLVCTQSFHRVGLDRHMENGCSRCLASATCPLTLKPQRVPHASFPLYTPGERLFLYMSGCRTSGKHAILPRGCGVLLFPKRPPIHVQPRATLLATQLYQPPAWCYTENKTRETRETEHSATDSTNKRLRQDQIGHVDASQDTRCYTS